MTEVIETILLEGSVYNKQGNLIQLSNNRVGFEDDWTLDWSLE